MKKEERESYKKIHLYKIDNEEYEKDKNNIGELLVFQGKEDISKQCKVIVSFSKEALIGLGTYSIRNWDKFNEDNHIHIEPLGQGLANQSMGFFLTPDSSEFIIGFEEFANLESLGIQNYSNKSLNNNVKFNKFEVDYLVNLNFDNDYFEYHNLEFKNIAELKVMKENIDISKECRVTLKLSKNGLLGLGTEALRLAHNFNKVSDFFITPVKSGEVNCLLGFFLTANSSILEICTKTFKDIFYYDPTFGK